jgi:hypothetical protein
MVAFQEADCPLVVKLAVEHLKLPTQNCDFEIVGGMR